MQSRTFSRLPVVGLLTLVYFIAGKFGLILASLHASASPVWPPAGIALAALLVLGYRAWPAIFVGAFLVNVTSVGNVATSLAIASGNTLEAICGAWLINRLAGGTTVFDRPQGVVKFALAAVVSTVISPAVGVTSLALGGFADWANFGAIWLTWWLGDTTGDLLIAPLIILWSIASKRRWNRREAVEAGILLLLLFVLSEAVFGGWLTFSARNYPIGFISGPIVIWTAFRFTQRETATGIFILSAIAIWGTLHGFGPFVGETENQSLLALQSWTAVLTITAMALAAGMAERRGAEEALRESEAHVSLAADAANLGLWFWNIRDDKLWVTEQWRRLFGFAESEPVSFDRVLQVVHPEDRERMKQRVQHMLEHGGGDHESEYRITRTEGVHAEDRHRCVGVYKRAFDAREPFTMEYRLRRSDGEYRWVLVSGTPRFAADGAFLGYIGSCIDITERKLAEEKFQLVLDAAPNAMIMVDSAGVINFANASATTVFGYSLSELIGCDIETLVPERFRDRHPDHRKVFFSQPSNRAMGAGRDLFGRRKDGSEFPVEIGLNPIRTAQGLFVLASVVDISARKFAEAEALQHQAQLGHLSRVAVLGELAASITHELNQPLSGIVSNASAGERFIDRGDCNISELRDLLADIVADGRRAGDVIRTFRGMIKKGDPTWQRVNLNDLVTNVVRMLNSDSMLRSCELEAMLDPNLPAIGGDPTQMQQVLLNLVINAFDAMRDTPLSHRKVVIATERNGDGAICTSVRDYGCGIPEEARERLFDHFFTTKAEGLGMGLGIVRSIVESHGGTIVAENVEGGGARFSFSILAEKGASK